jgi:hypothetical protein
MNGKKKLATLKGITDNREAGWKQTKKAQPKGGKKPGANSGITKMPTGDGTNRY